MNILQQSGGTYKRISTIANMYSMTPANVRLIVKEIESCPRYKNRWISLNDYGVRLINTLVFEDYMRYRGAIKSGLSKHLPPYDPAVVRRERGDDARGIRPTVGGDRPGNGSEKVVAHAGTA
jgi:hypothetical protein